MDAAVQDAPREPIHHQPRTSSDGPAVSDTREGPPLMLGWQPPAKAPHESVHKDSADKPLMIGWSPPSRLDGDPPGSSERVAAPVAPDVAEKPLRVVFQEAFITFTDPRSDELHKTATSVMAGYNGFFDHIGIRKGWRVAPLQQEEVQRAFQISSEIVALLRADLDRARGGGFIMRQLEGSAMDFLWGWPVGRQLITNEIFEEFMSGLVSATLSDGNGLVEGLDSRTVYQYMYSHPLLSC